MFNRKTTRSDVISVRLNDERLALLERYQAALTQRLGKSVSIAEAAFLMMEERAPAVDRATTRYELLQAPTASLDHIRKRWASKRTLSAGEWDLVTDYVQIGAEEERQEPPFLSVAVPSRASWLALLDAFEAVYQQRQTPASRHVWNYFGNLGGHATNVRLSDADAEQRHAALTALIADHRARLSDGREPGHIPGNVGRCFLLAVRDEGVDSTRLDQVLAPFWPHLWGLAARGHWIRHDHQPVRAAGANDDDVRRQIALPPAVTRDDFRVGFVSGGGLDLAVEIAFRDRRLITFLYRYPELVEFRAMLDAPDGQSWRGRNFEALVSREPDDDTRTVWLKRDAAIDCTPAEWRALGALFREAWAGPEVQRWLHELAQEYGEQG